MNMNVIQFSPGRSGSTLIWNLLRELDCNPKKMHQITYSRKMKIVSTIRDPRDILKSRLLITQKEIDKTSIDQEINLMLVCGMTTLTNIFSEPNVLLLKYELFYNDFDYIFDSLENFLHIKIDSNKKKELCDKYDITQMKKISQKYKHFKNYDKYTHVHGKHISDTCEPNKWKEVIPENFHDYINSALEKYIIIFGYDK